MSVQLPFTRSHAFVIGINDYQHVSPLKTAVSDAQSIADKLQSEHGYEVHGPLLNPTRDEMLDYLAIKMMQEVGENDRVIFYFAGHGIALDGEEGPNGYLVPADAKQGVKESLIPMKDLHWSLNELPCRHGLLILDCCFSGAFKWSSGYRDLVFNLPKVIYEERFWRYTKDPAWQVITSSAYDQKAVDVISSQSIGMREEGTGQHSPFAQALLEALDGAADVIPADHGDGVITASELYAYLRDGVETQTNDQVKRQSPSIFNLQRHDKGEFIFLNPRHRFNLPPTPDRNPFMGLASFNEADQAFFFGRNQAIDDLLDKLQEHPLVVVSGASGTGKSSVIKAGVLPRLRKADYVILPIIRPGKEPMETLETELPSFTQQVRGKKAVLVIDQYEELITQCLDEEERSQFEYQIAQWLKQFPDLRIILSIRSDFEPQFESEALAPWWLSGRFVVPAFSLEEIREVITQPAAQAVLFYEPIELVEQLSEEVSQAPGALPLLSFTLSELYHTYLKSGRQDRALKEEDYQELGGVIGALRTRADAEYQSLDEEAQHSMRTLMMRMVSLEGGELAGKRVYADELIFSDEAESERLQSIANQLVEARLLLRGKDVQGRVYVEPAHDALVRAWARLWEWIKTAGEEKISLQYKLSQAVNDYHELVEVNPKKAKNLLWNNNPRLALLTAELQEQHHSLNAREEAFVRESANLRLKKRNTFIGNLASIVVVALLLTTFSGFLMYFSLTNQDQINHRIMASSLKSLMNTDEESALKLAKYAYKETIPTSLEVVEVLHTILDKNTDKPEYASLTLSHEKKIKDLDFSDDGSRILTTSADGQVRLWDADTNDLLAELRHEEVERAKFVMEDEHMITWGGGEVNIWSQQGEALNRTVISPHIQEVFLHPFRPLFLMYESGFEGRWDSSMWIILNYETMDAQSFNGKRTVEMIQDRPDLLDFMLDNQGKISAKKHKAFTHILDDLTSRTNREKVYAISSDLNKIVRRESDKELTVYDLQKNSEESLPFLNSIYDYTCILHEKGFVTRGEYDLLWNWDGTVRDTLADTGIRDIQFLPDDQGFYTLTENEVIVWNWEGESVDTIYHEDNELEDAKWLSADVCIHVGSTKLIMTENGKNTELSEAIAHKVTYDTDKRPSLRINADSSYFLIPGLGRPKGSNLLGGMPSSLWDAEGKQIHAYQVFEDGSGRKLGFQEQYFSPNGKYLILNMGNYLFLFTPNLPPITEEELELSYDEKQQFGILSIGDHMERPDAILDTVKEWLEYYFLFLMLAYTILFIGEGYRKKEFLRRGIMLALAVFVLLAPMLETYFSTVDGFIGNTRSIVLFSFGVFSLLSFRRTKKDQQYFLNRLYLIIFSLYLLGGVFLAYCNFI